MSTPTKWPPPILTLKPQGGFGHRFQSGARCGTAEPGILIEHEDMPSRGGEWHCSVLTKEDAIALRDFLDAHIPECITTK